MYSVLIKVCCTVQCCAEIKSKSTPDSNNSTETYSPTSCCHDDEQTRPAATEPWEQDAQLSHAHTHTDTHGYPILLSLLTFSYHSFFLIYLAFFLCLFIPPSLLFHTSLWILSLFYFFPLFVFSPSYSSLLLLSSSIYLFPSFSYSILTSFYSFFFFPILYTPPLQSFNCSFFHPLLISAFCFLFLSIFILSSCSVLPSLSLNRHKCVHGFFFVFLT